MPPPVSSRDSKAGSVPGTRVQQPGCVTPLRKADDDGDRQSMA